jgi:hypothetical protein
MKPEIDPQIKAAKAAYKQRLSEAVQWLQGEGCEEKPATAARIYRVDANAIRMALKRTQRYTEQRAQVQHGGQNKVLSDTQSKAIEAYYYE